MKIPYSRPVVSQGRANQAKQQEAPNTFATDSGVDNITQNSRLDKPKQRMAGQFGHRVMEYMNDPEEQARTDSWMSMFELSNEGQQFNQAKMGGGPPQQ